MAPPVSVPTHLPELVRASFDRARAAGDLIFFPTQATLLHVQGLPPFQLRFAPSLAKKPKAKDASSSQPADTGTAPPFDPFADPPRGLIVLPQLGPHHRLVLNKFAVCRDHAILATAVFQPQDHLLDATDLAAAWACIDAYDRAPENDGEGLFIFYNSGPHSGASQPHRHLQLLPVARMREGLSATDAAAWRVLVDQVLSETAPESAPFSMAVARVPADPSPDALHALYMQLYSQAQVAAAGTAAVLTRAFSSGDDGENNAERQGRVPAQISYNLALTRRTMAVCPRTADSALLVAESASNQASSTLPSEVAGSLSLNGTLLAGTALVKSEQEWAALRADPVLLTRVLRAVSVKDAQS